MLKPLAAALLLFVAVANAQTGSFDNDISDTDSYSTRSSLASSSMTDAEHTFRSGNVLVAAGHLLAAGGVVMNVLGTTGGNPDLALLGNLGFNIGIPLVGAGAGSVARAVKKLNPDYRANYRGWGWYLTGFILGTTGGILLNSAVKEANQAESWEAHDEALDNTLFPVLLIVGSGVCGIVTWVKFTMVADEAGRAYSYQKSLRVDPKLSLSRDGDFAPGMMATYSF